MKESGGKETKGDVEGKGQTPFIFEHGYVCGVFRTCVFMHNMM